MTEEHTEGLRDEELETEDGVELPDREAMSLITPEPLDGGLVLPVSSEDEEIFVFPRDPATSN